MTKCVIGYRAVRRVMTEQRTHHHQCHLSTTAGSQRRMHMEQKKSRLQICGGHLVFPVFFFFLTQTAFPDFRYTLKKYTQKNIIQQSMCVLVFCVFEHFCDYSITAYSYISGNILGNIKLFF